MEPVGKPQLAAGEKRETTRKAWRREIQGGCRGGRRRGGGGMVAGHVGPVALKNEEIGDRLQIHKWVRRHFSDR